MPGGGGTAPAVPGAGGAAVCSPKERIAPLESSSCSAPITRVRSAASAGRPVVSRKVSTPRSWKYLSTSPAPGGLGPPAPELFRAESAFAARSLAAAFALSRKPMTAPRRVPREPLARSPRKPTYGVVAWLEFRTTGRPTAGTTTYGETTAMTIHGSLFTDFRENTSQDPFSLQNKKLLKIQMGYGPVWALTGSMVAYQGDVKFVNTGSGGLDKFLKSKLTGEGVNMMQCTGTGELFVANLASEIQVMYLENDMISVNGANVLAFSSSIEWDVHITTAWASAKVGALATSRAPTFADAQAVVMWTSGV